MSKTTVTQAGAGGRVYEFRPAPIRTESEPNARARRPAPPMYRVIDAVLTKEIEMPAWARLVAIAIARRFNADGYAFMSIRDIAARTGLSWHCVWRALKLLRTMSPQIIAMRRKPNKKRTRRGCYEFQLVLNPERFTDARDRAHAEKFTPKHLRVLWNRAAREHDLPVCVDLTADREAEAAQAIAKNPSPAYWTDAIARMVDSNFVHGVTFNTDRDGPSAPKGFDFLIRYHVQISEGKYE